MGVGGKGYTSEFKVFNRFVIKPAVAEINQVTDFQVEVEEKREKRKVVAIKFKGTPGVTAYITDCEARGAFP